MLSLLRLIKGGLEGLYIGKKNHIVSVFTRYYITMSSSVTGSTVSGHNLNDADHCFSNTGLGPKDGLRGLLKWASNFPVNTREYHIMYYIICMYLPFQTYNFLLTIEDLWITLFCPRKPKCSYYIFGQNWVHSRNFFDICFTNIEMIMS